MNITVIIPLHKINETYIDLMQNCLSSIKEFSKEVKVLIVAPNAIKTELDNVSFGKKLSIKKLYHDGDSSFTNQMNVGISACDTKYFSICEVDDTYHKNWLKYIKEYLSLYPDAEMILPLIKNKVNGKNAGLTNEAIWAVGFSQLQGVLTNDAILNYDLMQTSGGLFLTEKAISIGLFKTNIELTFNYEFLLRFTNNSNKCYVIPRIGYVHDNFREDSLYWLYKNDEKFKIDPEKAEFWTETARREFFYKEQRDIILK